MLSRVDVGTGRPRGALRGEEELRGGACRAARARRGCDVAWAGIAFLIGLSSGPSPLRAETPLLAFPDASVEVYKQASGDDLRLYLFFPEDHDAEQDARPAVVFFFGGGWIGGTPRQFEQHARYLAARGMVAAVADYRVKSRQGTSPLESVRDGKSAVRYLRTHAGRLGIDPDRIAAGGGSAGGHVAAAAGIVQGLEEPGEPSTIASTANALLLFNPVYDNGPDGYGHERVAEHFPAISPLHNLSKTSPPTIVFLGTEDTLIPVSTAEDFRDRLAALGVRTELHLYEGQPHGFFNERTGGTQIFFDTLRKMDTFLAGLGYLQGSPDEEALRAVSRPGSE